MKRTKHAFSVIALTLAMCMALGSCGTTAATAPAESPAENSPSASAAGSPSAESGTSPATETAKTEPAAEQVFTFASGNPLPGIHPFKNTDAPENEMYDIFLETLVRYEADSEGKAAVLPGMAEDWEISDDGKTYTFYLRDAVWSDGVPVTADDFIFTYQSMADPNSGSTNGWLFEGLVENFTESLYNDGTNPEYDKLPTDIGVTAPDDKTVVFTLTRSAPFFMELLASPKPLRRDKAEEWGDAYGSSADTIVTNGAFKIESWTQNVEMTLVKNENYWNAANVKLDRINRKVLQDTATSVQALLSGDIDTMGTSDPNWQQMIEESGGFYGVTTSSRAPEFLAFNCSNEYFKNPKIRLAFSLAIDREKFVNDLLSGLGAPIETLMPNVIYVGETIYEELVGGQNNEILNDLRAQYPDPKALLIEGLTEEGLDPDPAKMQIRYASRGTAEISRKISEWYYQQFQEILGVTITIEMMEWNIMWDMIDQGNYDIATSGWGPYYNDPEALLGLFHLDNGFFDQTKSGWSDADAQRFAEILDEAKMKSTAEEKAPLYLEAEKLLLGTGVIAPVYLPSGYVYISNRVKDLTFNPNAYTDYNKVYVE